MLIFLIVIDITGEIKNYFCYDIQHFILNDKRRHITHYGSVRIYEYFEPLLVLNELVHPEHVNPDHLH